MGFFFRNYFITYSQNQLGMPCALTILTFSASVISEKSIIAFEELSNKYALFDSMIALQKYAIV